MAAMMLSGNSLRQTVPTHHASVHQTAKLVAALLIVARVTAGLAESNGSLPQGYLQADQLQNPTLDNRVWATFRRICDIYDFFAPHRNVLTYLLTFTFFTAGFCD